MIGLTKSDLFSGGKYRYERQIYGICGSYSYTGKAKGITVFDVDVEKGTFKERCEMEVNNSSYVIASSDGKTLYSIADEGVVSFRILQNGAWRV